MVCILKLIPCLLTKRIERAIDGCCSLVSDILVSCYKYMHMILDRLRNQGCSGSSRTHNIQPVDADNVLCTRVATFPKNRLSAPHRHHQNANKS